MNTAPIIGSIAVSEPLGVGWVSMVDKVPTGSPADKMG